MENSPIQAAHANEQDKGDGFITMDINVQEHVIDQQRMYFQPPTNQMVSTYSPQDMFMLELQRILRMESNKKFYQNQVLDVPMVRLSEYHDLAKIRMSLPSCVNVNDSHADFSNLRDAEFFVVRSTCDDDIHKAIKYGVWTSTHVTNLHLNETLERCQKKGVPLFIIFTVVNSNQFCGIAQMTSPVDFEKIFDYWWEDLKWSGLFSIKWVYIRDVSHSELSTVAFNKTNITLLKDGERVPFEAGKQVLEIFQKKNVASNIFEVFSFMDVREGSLRIKRDCYFKIIKLLKEKGFVGRGQHHRHNREVKPETESNPHKPVSGRGARGGRRGYRGSNRGQYKNTPRDNDNGGYQKDYRPSNDRGRGWNGRGERRFETRGNFKHDPQRPELPEYERVAPQTPKKE